jgi:hypothetical protein
MKIHRDRSNDAVRAAKDSPPLRGRPASPADPGHLRYWVWTLAPTLR